jgi:hypothetical protein
MAGTNIDKTEQNVDACGTIICKMNKLFQKEQLLQK